MDPYAALRYREFNIFLLVRFALVFAWSMQFVVIEWEVYSLTKDPLSLGIIGLMEVIPAVSLALFAGGLGYYLHTYFTAGRFTNMGMLLFVSSIVVFLIGLVSEQITMLLYQRTNKE